MLPTLSPRQLARAIDASESSVKRWADEGLIAAHRTAGGHRRIPRHEAVRFVRATGISVLDPGVLGLAEAPATSLQPAEDDAERLFAALNASDRGLAIGLIHSWFLAGRSPAEIFDGPLRTAMVRIGTQWEDSPDGIVVEHVATGICAEAIGRIRAALPPAADDAPVAVGGAPTGDPYILPSLTAATVLHDLGMKAVNLGPDTPLPALPKAAAREDAAVVWLSVSSEQVVEDVRTALPELADRLARLSTELVVGGRVHERLCPMRRAHLTFVSTLAELAAFARGLMSPARTTPGRG